MKRKFIYALIALCVMAAAAVKGLSEENKDGQKGSSVGNVEASENKAGHSGPMSGTSEETCWRNSLMLRTKSCSLG